MHSESIKFSQVLLQLEVSTLPNSVQTFENLL